MAAGKPIMSLKFSCVVPENIHAFILSFEEMENQMEAIVYLQGGGGFKSRKEGGRGMYFICYNT